MYNCLTLTKTYKKSGIVGVKNIYRLEFLNSINESINFQLEFETFDEGVGYLGSKGYLLNSIIQHPSASIVEKGWFSKKLMIN